MTGRTTVLFVCVHNAGRSQMAAAWLQHLAGDLVEVLSAGSAPAEAINPAAVEAMAEVGIDIAGAQPKVLTTETVHTCDVVITMGCGDECPILPGKRYLDWNLEDPAGLGVSAVRVIRDEIRARVEVLVAELSPIQSEPGTCHQPTPYLEIDAARMQANILRIAHLAATRGVVLRPHVKTHKCLEIARLQVAAGAGGISVATLGEAEVFVDAGFDDVFIAYPLWLSDAQVPRLQALRARTLITVGVDSAEAASRLASAGDVRVMVEVDSGHHRSGVSPDRAGEVARAAEAHGLDVVGVFTFPGHSYAPDRTTSAADDEASALAEAAASMTRIGIAPSVISGGSTPSLATTLSSDSPATELRPGVYVFGDAQQWELGTCDPDDIALTCLATVISHAGGRVVLDSGSKILGADRAAYATGFGRLLDHPEARIVILSEHHAVVEISGPLPALGSQLRVVPNHACNAVNLVDALEVDDFGVRRQWPVAARGRNS